MDFGEFHSRAAILEFKNDVWPSSKVFTSFKDNIESRKNKPMCMCVAKFVTSLNDKLRDPLEIPLNIKNKKLNTEKRLSQSSQYVATKIFDI